MRAVLQATQDAAERERLVNVDPAAALQELISRFTARWRHACDEVDQLRPEQLTIMTAYGPVDHEWIRAEERLGAQLAKLCVEVERIGLADRLISLEEAKAQMFVRALQAAAADIGISRDQVRDLGPAFRTRLAQIEAGDPSQNRLAA